MSETVKLIIEIPKDYYEIIKHDIEHHLTDYRPFEIIGNGIPLDDVKAEIQKMYREAEFMDEFSGGCNYAIGEVLEILENIGKGDSK